MTQALGYASYEELQADVGASRPFSMQVPADAAVPVFQEVPAGNGDFDPADLGARAALANQLVVGQTYQLRGRLSEDHRGIKLTLRQVGE